MVKYTKNKINNKKQEFPNNSKNKELMKPPTISIWEKARTIKIKNKEKIIRNFLKIVKDVKEKKYKFKKGDVEMNGFWLVNEENRNGSSFIHIVPKESYETFNEIKRRMPEMILGFSILCGKNKNKSLKVSCYGIPIADINKVMMSKKK